MSSLGLRLKEVRERKKLSQLRAAELLGIRNNQLSRYESDVRRPDPEMLTKLADFYGTTSDYLLGMIDDPTPNNLQVSDKDKMTLQEIKEMIEKGLIRDNLSEEKKHALISYIDFLRNT